MSAQTLLRKAADLIEQRGTQRDQPNGEKSMAKTVKAFWEIHGTAILGRGHMTEVEGWHFMEILKMVRSAYGVYVPDDFEDKVAYAALAAEAAEAAVPVPAHLTEPVSGTSLSVPVPRDSDRVQPCYACDYRANGQEQCLPRLTLGKCEASNRFRYFSLKKT